MIACTFLAAILAVAAALPFNGPTDNIVPGSYIVRLQGYTTEKSFHEHTQRVMRIIKEKKLNAIKEGMPSDLRDQDDPAFPDGIHFQTNEQGRRWYAAKLDDDIVWKISRDSLVQSVRPERYIYPFSQTDADALVTHESSSWGLAAISHRSQVSANTPYVSRPSTGREVFAYVIDSGILADHEDFEGRVTFGADFTGAPFPDNDWHGHGTQVAAVIGGARYGIAPKATIIDVRVASSGPTRETACLSGLRWAVQDILTQSRVDRSVINISWGKIGGHDAELQEELQSAHDKGITMVFAAGNDAQDMERLPYMPACSKDGITVAAMGPDYKIAPFSNHGEAADIFAPGVAIPSASSKCASCYSVSNGTSLAASHVAGVVAHLLDVEGPRTAEQMWKRLRALSTKKRVKKTKKVENRLLFNGAGLE